MDEVIPEISKSLELRSNDCDLGSVRLRGSLATIAALIELGNEDLWPIFEKLENELSRIELRKSRLLKYSQHKI